MFFSWPLADTWIMIVKTFIILMGSYDAPNISKDKIQTHKGSKECYLLRQDTTCEFSGYAHVSSFKTKCPFSPSLCHNKYHFLKTFYMFGSCFRMLAVILV